MATVWSITVKSPAWRPQARFALVIRRTIAASSPSVQWPKLSPRSLLKSIARVVSAICRLLAFHICDEHIAGRVRDHQLDPRRLGRRLRRHPAAPEHGDLPRRDG